MIAMIVCVEGLILACKLIIHIHTQPPPRERTCKEIHAYMYAQMQATTSHSLSHTCTSMNMHDSEMEVDAWVPTPSQVGRMRSFFLGGSPEVKDLSFAGVPPAATASLSSRYCGVCVCVSARTQCVSRMPPSDHLCPQGTKMRHDAMCAGTGSHRSRRAQFACG